MNVQKFLLVYFGPSLLLMDTELCCVKNQRRCQVQYLLRNAYVCEAYQQNSLQLLAYLSGTMPIEEAELALKAFSDCLILSSKLLLYFQ